jgi:signal peptidase II
VQERRAVVAPLRSGAGTPPVRSRRGWALVFAVAAAVVVLDQLTKTWALRHLRDGPRHVVWTLRFNLTFNTGIAFSQASGSTAVVTVIALVVVALLLVIARRTRGALTGVVLGLVIGGAVGNLLDRLVRHHGGAVIDFIDLQWWPVFNVADAAITIGVVIALVRAVFAPTRGRAEAA